MPAGEVSAGTQARKPPGNAAPNMPSSLAALALLLSPPAFDPPNEVVGLTGAVVELEVELEVELDAGAATVLRPVLALSGDVMGLG